MIQLLLASSAFQTLSLAAMVRAGDMGDAERRILVAAHNATIPELGHDLRSTAGIDVALAAFDQVESLNEAIWPIHPRDFAVTPELAPLLQRYLRGRWGLGDEPVDLVLESLPNAPGGSLARIFDDAPISMHSDGLMSYGPLRNKLPDAMSHRIERVYYTDLVPGLVPLRLNGHHPQLVPSSGAELRRIFDEVGEAAAGPNRSEPWPEGTALLLGQYLTDLGILSRAEETALHVQMVESAVAAGRTNLVLKPHPASSAADLAPLAARAAELGVRLEVLTSPLSAEALMGQRRPDLVVSAFSTALVTAAFLYRLETHAVGTELVLQRAEPYENSNRVPAVLCDALFVRGIPAPAHAPAHLPLRRQLQELVTAVVACMQPVQEAQLKPRARAYLADAAGQDEMRYFRTRRLLDAGLVAGTAPARSLSPLSRLAGKARRRAVQLVRSTRG